MKHQSNLPNIELLCIVLESEGSTRLSSNFLEVKPRQQRSKSWQPELLSWDKEKHLSIQPEVIGSMIESYIMGKRVTSEKPREENPITDLEYRR